MLHSNCYIFIYMHTSAVYASRQLKKSAQKVNPFCSHQCAPVLQLCWLLRMSLHKPCRVHRVYQIVALDDGYPAGISASWLTTFSLLPTVNYDQFTGFKSKFKSSEAVIVQ